ncbi:MAG: 5'/3'-nucleotidase SurE [Deltaproteobacteria bacterium]|nr:5'/3'-nucleotidase SurE [Deltaproteobacteria bacterium]MCB9488525.1 5'/3'-nucleotidase SurE [Deltaproteobacteria bacterium]
MKILVSNDDGIHSDGLLALRDALSELGEVTVVAPDRERSAQSHALTIHRPLRVHQVEERFYSVDGTPADAVHLALNVVMRDERPDLVVSGINQGGNLGDDVTYSGTVAAAREAAMLGVPSFAVSVVARTDFHFDGAAAFALRLARHLRDHPLQSRSLLNVNVPNVRAHELPEYRFTQLGQRIFSDEVVEKADPRGASYYWIGGQELGFTRAASSDLQAISEGFISVSPIRIDQTDYDLLTRLAADGPDIP